MDIKINDCDYVIYCNKKDVGMIERALSGVDRNLSEKEIAVKATLIEASNKLKGSDNE